MILANNDSQRAWEGHLILENTSSKASPWRTCQMSWLIAVFEAEVRASQNREQTPDIQISSHPAQLHASQGTQL